MEMRKTFRKRIALYIFGFIALLATVGAVARISEGANDWHGMAIVAVIFAGVSVMEYFDVRNVRISAYLENRKILRSGIVVLAIILSILLAFVCAAVTESVLFGVAVLAGFLILIGWRMVKRSEE